MRTSKEYRQTAWSAIKPVLPIMLLIALVASLPQFIFMFIQTAFGLMPPMDTDLLLSDPDAFVAAYSAFMSSSKGITYSLLNTLFTLMTIPLTLGSISAAQRILRGEDVLVRHSLAYIPYTFRAIWLPIKDWCWYAVPEIRGVAHGKKSHLREMRKMLLQWGRRTGIWLMLISLL